MGIIKQAVRDLRKRQTKCEEIFWDMVRNKRILGKKFYRQHPIKYKWENRTSFFVADFYCSKAKLIIEVDGGIHDKTKDRDKIRELIIKRHGYKILRISNDEVLTNLESVKQKLMNLISK
jgi:very-short-patch-repair endonuclease